MAFSALLDACVLFPMSLRDTLLRLGEAGFYRVRWSEQILDEVKRNILDRYPSISAERFDRTLDHMRMAFPDAAVTGYESLIDAMSNAPEDRHVLAAAVAGRADVIVTDNVGDFPAEACQPLGIDVQTADEFLVHLLHLEPDAVFGVLRRQAADKEHRR